jgi:uncharacterized RDD family membrane protein YckC
MAIIHPIFSVLVSRPELVLEHISGYATLAQEEASSVGAELAKRAAAWAVCGVAALLFLVFTGVAVMLGALHDEFSWALVIVPAVPLVLAVAAFMKARERLPARAFDELRRQLDADAQALRTLGGKP